jgi:hypothetical protein
MAVRRTVALVALFAVTASDCGGGKELSQHLKDRFAREHVKLVNHGLGGDEYASVDVLAPPGNSSPFGASDIEVPREGGVDRFLKGLRPDGAGVFWERKYSGYGDVTWAAKKPYGDRAVLTWEAGTDKATDARFERLDAIVREVVAG